LTYYVNIRGPEILTQVYDEINNELSLEIESYLYHLILKTPLDILIKKYSTPLKKIKQFYNDYTFLQGFSFFQ
jgi:hypothetical protein